MKQHTARELLFLERTAQLRDLTEEETDRWQELAILLFAHDEKNGPKRKTSRLMISTQAQVEIGAKSFKCDVTEISQVNLTLSNADLDDVSLGDNVNLKSILVNADHVILNLCCKVKRLRKDVKGIPAMGIEIVGDAGKEAVRKYFHSAYYPLYIKYIETLAASAD